MELQKVGHDLATKQQQFLQVCWIYLGGREEAGCSFFISSFFGHWSHSWNLVPQLDMDISLIRMKVKATQSCLTLCDPMDYTVHEILHGLSQSPWNTEVSSSLSLFQGIFPTQVADGFFTSWATREAQVDQDVLVLNTKAILHIAPCLKFCDYVSCLLWNIFWLDIWILTILGNSSPYYH